MFRASSVYSLSDFVSHLKKQIKRLKATGKPEILTVDGKAALVVQIAAAFQRMIDKILDGTDLQPEALLENPKKRKT